MAMKQARFFLLLIGLLALGLAACSSSDDPTEPVGGGGGDTTAPQVAATDPASNDTGVSQDEEITITFNEPMDPATATGNITLSSGAVTSATWTDTRTLVVDHSAWAEGATITVTVGSALADAAGNTLAAAYPFSFYVYSSDLTVLDNSPADGATGINRDASIQLLFSNQVTRSSLEANTTVTSAAAPAGYDFTTNGDGSAVTIMVTETLPAGTEITVTVGADVATGGGQTLGTDFVFSFTTGTDVDNTPPTVVSSSPAVGSSFDPDFGYFQITFSEPVDPMSFEPSSWNAEAALILMNIDATPAFTEGGTVVTVPLPLSLPAGLPIEIVFSAITDLAGNALASPWVFEATVAGAADYYPVADNLEMTFEDYREDGTQGSSTPDNSGGGTRYLKMVMQDDDSFLLGGYEEDFTTLRDTPDIYKKVSNQLQWLGFVSGDPQGTQQAVYFNTPVKYLPLPLATGTWTSSTSVTVPDEGSYTATLNGTVVGQFDLPIDEGMFYKDTWKVIRRFEVNFEGTLAMVQTDTTWYSPTLGRVQSTSYEDALMDGKWHYEALWRVLGFRR